MEHNWQRLRCTLYPKGEGLLNDEQQQQYLSAISQQWHIHLNNKQQATLQRSFNFNNYQQTLAFVNQVADLAEQQNHHPDMLVQWGQCSINFTTHSANGITLNDFICANHVDSLHKKVRKK